jgi:hypothetical protein
MVALRFVEMEPVWAEKIAVVAPAGTITAAGTANIGELLARKTVAPPAGAAGEIVTVQLVEDALRRAVGLQARDVTPKTTTAVPLALIGTALPAAVTPSVLVTPKETNP